MPTSEIKIAFIKERETKGAVRYQEVDSEGRELLIGAGAKVGTLYIRKDAINGQLPNAIGVTITYNI